MTFDTGIVGYGEVGKICARGLKDQIPAGARQT